MRIHRPAEPVAVESRRRSARLNAAIRRMVEQIVDLFHPDKIVLFGSHAYGRPSSDSDVDVLVVMPTKNPVAQACGIRLAVEHPFPLDLLVRTPEYLEARLIAGDSFVREVLSQGKVLYEKPDGRVGAKGRGRLQGCRATRQCQAARQ
jgi:predicted nucleotidyltransferase